MTDLGLKAYYIALHVASEVHGGRIDAYIDGIEAEFTRQKIRPTRDDLIRALAQTAALVEGNRRRDLAARQLEASWVTVCSAVDAWRHAVANAEGETTPTSDPEQPDLFGGPA